MVKGTGNGDQARRDEIERIRAANPAVQVIGRYVDLKKQGRLWKGLCPFHKEDTPSLTVYEGDRGWWCYGCHQGGDVFKFVMLIEKVNFKEAVARLNTGALASVTRISRPAAGQSAPRRAEARIDEEHYAFLTLVKDVYHAAVFGVPEVMEYLASRGVDEAMVREFQIGYCTGDELQRYFRLRGWKWVPEAASDLGLLAHNRAGKEYEYFWKRIIIPDLYGEQACYLVGRKTQEAQKIPYLGLPGVPKPLFGLDRLDRSVRGHELFVSEGPFDWLTLVKWGYNAVCLLGSHLKSEFKSIVRAYPRVYVVTDFDEPGRLAAKAIACDIGANAIVPRGVPGVKDINEMEVKQPNARALFAEMIRGADLEARLNHDLRANIQSVQDALLHSSHSCTGSPSAAPSEIGTLWGLIRSYCSNGRTVLLHSRRYRQRGRDNNPLLVGTHVIRSAGPLKGAHMFYSMRRGAGQWDQICDLQTAEYGELLEESEEPSEAA